MDDRSSASTNRGNFWTIMEMMAKGDDTLREHLETGRKNAQYTLGIIQKEVVDVVAEYIRKENTRSLEDENGTCWNVQDHMCRASHMLRHVL